MLSHTSFKESLNSPFHVRCDGGNVVVLDLVQVSDVRVQGPFESYSLEFKGPGDTYLKQMTYEVPHNAMGTHPIFLVPVGRTDKGYQYQAVFSRKK